MIFGFKKHKIYYVMACVGDHFVNQGSILLLHWGKPLVLKAVSLFGNL